MDWNQDAELQEVFKAEMDERAPRLVEAAVAMRDGTLNEDLVTVAAREAHTVKGTARVMGFNLIADVGAELEELWKSVADRRIEPTGELGERVLGASQHILDAVAADPDEGTPELRSALHALRGNEEPPPKAEAPRAAEPAAPKLELIQGGKQEHDEPAASNPDIGNLGGLLATKSVLGGGETTAVDTIKMYRLINQVAELRLDAGALSATVGALRMAATSSPMEAASLATRWEIAVDNIMDAVQELQRQAIGLVAVPLSTLTGTLPGLVRFLARKTGKEVRLELIGDDVEVDLQILDRLADVIRNLAVNAIEHGLEVPEDRTRAGKTITGTLNVTAVERGGQLELTISDDGRGVDWQAVEQTARSKGVIRSDEEADQSTLVRVLFEEGVSTSAAHSELSGSGDGFKNVAKAINEMNGSVQFESSPAGTVIQISVPAFQALQRALIVSSGGRDWGIPEAAVLDRFPVIDAEITEIAGHAEILWRDGMISLGSFAAAAGIPDSGEMHDVVIVSTNVGPRALGVEAVQSVREVAARSLGPLVAGNPYVTGAAMLGGGELALMVDPNSLGDGSPTETKGRPTVMVVDDSPGVQQLVAGSLAAGGFEAVVAGSTEEALALLSDRPVDALVVDFSMPGSDGVTLAESVRNRYGPIPIVMVSAVANREDQERAKRAGIDAYFDKSDFREGALVSTLHSLVGTADRRTARAR